MEITGAVVKLQQWDQGVWILILPPISAAAPSKSLNISELYFLFCKNKENRIYYGELF